MTILLLVWIFHGFRMRINFDLIGISITQKSPAMTINAGDFLLAKPLKNIILQSGMPDCEKNDNAHF